MGIYYNSCGKLTGVGWALEGYGSEMISRVYQAINPWIWKCYPFGTLEEMLYLMRRVNSVLHRALLITRLSASEGSNRYTPLSILELVFSYAPSLKPSTNSRQVCWNFRTRCSTRFAWSLPGKYFGLLKDFRSVGIMWSDFMMGSYPPFKFF